MKNEKLTAFMELRGMTKTQLSTSSGIPTSTLNRIINGSVQKVKLRYMEAIACALDTTVQSIFDISGTPVDIPWVTTISPEEAGKSVTKVLSENESLLLYLVQNTYPEDQEAIINYARTLYVRTQKRITRKLHSLDGHTVKKEEFEQLSLPLQK